MKMGAFAVSKRDFMILGKIIMHRWEKAILTKTVPERHLFLCEKFIDKITIVDIMVTIRAIYYINVLKGCTLEAGGTCRREYYPC